MVREAAQPAAAPVEQHEPEADDHRRDRERQIDHRVQQAAPGEAAADEASAQHDPDDRVHRHGDRRDQQRQPERVQRLRRRDRVPGLGEAVLERAVEDEPDRHEQNQRQVSEHAEAQQVSSTVVPRPPAAEGADRQQHAQGDRQQQHDTAAAPLPSPD